MITKLEKAKNIETVLAQAKDFYWNLIDEMKDQQSRIGWKKRY